MGDPREPCRGGQRAANYYETQADWDLALDLFYAELGFDQTTGAPTRATLTSMGLAYVADELEALSTLNGPVS